MATTIKLSDELVSEARRYAEVYTLTLLALGSHENFCLDLKRH